MGLIFLKNSKVGMFFLISISFISCKSYQKIGGENSNYIPYYLKVYEADSLFLVKNYSLAYEKYDSLFKYYKPINMPLYFEFENYIKAGLLSNKKKNFKNEFKKIVTNYGYTYGNIEKDTLLKMLALRFKKSKKNIDITNKPQEIAKSIFDGKNSFRSSKKVAKAHIIIQYEYALQSLFLLYYFFLSSGSILYSGINQLH